MLIIMNNIETQKTVSVDFAKAKELEKAIEWLNEVDGFREAIELPEVAFEKDQECDCPICSMNREFEKNRDTRVEIVRGEPGMLYDFLKNIGKVDDGIGW